MLATTEHTACKPTHKSAQTPTAAMAATMTLLAAGQQASSNTHQAPTTAMCLILLVAHCHVQRHAAQSTKTPVTGLSIWRWLWSCTRICLVAAGVWINQRTLSWVSGC
jgi:hypothetical protein